MHAFLFGSTLGPVSSDIGIIGNVTHVTIPTGLAYWKHWTQTTLFLFNAKVNYMFDSMYGYDTRDVYTSTTANWFDKH